MRYCKKCGSKSGVEDNFCEKCGSKLISQKSLDKNQINSYVNVSPSNKHVLPAFLSFFVPALGQFIKGQVGWGLIIWLWFILGNFILFASSGIFGEFTIVLVIIYNLFLWIYQIYDAYNAPEETEVAHKIIEELKKRW